MLVIYQESLDGEALFNELQCYIESKLSELLRKYGLPEDFIYILAFIESRYCRLKRLKEGLNSIINRIDNDRLSRDTKSRLVEFVEKFINSNEISKLINLRARILKELRRVFGNITILSNSKGADFMQCCGFMLADGSSCCTFDLTTGIQLNVILQTLGSVKVRFNTMYLRASDFSVTLSLTAEPLDRELSRSLVEWRRRLLCSGDVGEFCGLDYWGWVRFFAGLFDGDGFVKVKHRYAVDVGVSCGADVKGRVVRKILEVGETLGLFVLGRYDVRSCKLYLRLCERTLRFLWDVVRFLNHSERRFKLERFLMHRMCMCS